MTWIAAEGFGRRPLVVVEDHLYHITELLDRLGGSDPLHGQLTVVCLDRAGPDTSRTVAHWLAACPGLQAMAAVEPPESVAAAGGDAGVGGPAGAEGGDPAGGAGPEGRAGGGGLANLPGERFRALPSVVFSSAHRLAQAIAAALRPGGLLLQDIQLETLAFIPADRWWESIYVASTVRGMFAEHPPACRFFSNKRGYEATFGRELLDAGFDPRDVIDKGDLARAVVPILRSALDRGFPFTLRLAAPGREPWTLRVSPAGAERLELERELDLLLWSGDDGTVELSGRALPHDPAQRRLAYRAGNQEALTWSALVADRLGGGPGLPVLEVGRRLAPPDAGKPELTNVAARHIHTLRGRLEDPSAILTCHHTYRLGERLAVGLAARADPR